MLTALISLGSIWLFFAASHLQGYTPRNIELSSPISILVAVVSGSGGVLGFERIYFYSAFFTSAWLWLYMLSVLASRVLLRMNSGVGFLLRVTDVERQPFRSMGFVSVIVASLIFLMGLPLVLV